MDGVCVIGENSYFVFMGIYWRIMMLCAVIFVFSMRLHLFSLTVSLEFLESECLHILLSMFMCLCKMQYGKKMFDLLGWKEFVLNEMWLQLHCNREKLICLFTFCYCKALLEDFVNHFCFSWYKTDPLNPL